MLNNEYVTGVLVDFQSACIVILWTNIPPIIYEGWNFNSGNYLFTTDTK